VDRNQAARLLHVDLTAHVEEIIDAHLEAVKPVHPALHQLGTPEREAAEIVFARLTDARDILLRDVTQVPIRPQRRAVTVPLPSTTSLPIEQSTVLPVKPSAAPISPYTAAIPLAPREQRGLGTRIGLIGAIVVALVIIAVPIFASGANLAHHTSATSAGPHEMWWTDTTGNSWECPSDNACWVWTLEFKEECSDAVLTVEFSDTEGGNNVEKLTRHLILVAPGQAEKVVVNSGSHPQFAAIESVMCQDSA